MRHSLHALLPAAHRFALPPRRRLPAPSKLPTLAVPRPSLWAGLLAFLEPAPARERRERAAVVLPLKREFRLSRAA